MVDFSPLTLLPDNRWLRIALLAGSTVYLVALTQVMVVTWLHFRNARHKRRVAALKHRFAPIFVACLEGTDLPVPPCKPRDLLSVLIIWLFYIESTRGESRERLRRLGCAMELPSRCLNLLAQGNLSARLVAISALGRLREPAAWDALQRWIDDDDPTLSLTALRAAIQIDASRGLASLMERLSARTDWPEARLNTMLREAPKEDVEQALLEGLTRGNPKTLPQVVRWLEIAQPADVWGRLLGLLEQHASIDVVASVLHVARDPRLLPAIRSLAEHPYWVVRTKVASALGRLGDKSDIERLGRLLCDPVWWVRYRAACALIALPFFDRKALETWGNRLDDQFAKDMLSQTLAEHVGRN